MTKFTMNYHGGYKIKMRKNVLSIFAPSHTSGKTLNPQISVNIVNYLMNEGFFEDIPNKSNISVITHEAA